MPKLKVFFTLVILTLLAACEPQVNKQDGYHVMNFVDQEANQQPQVIEFFGYFCPHCYQLEPTIQRWKRLKSKNIEFIRIPVDFGKPQGIPAAKAYYVAEKFNIVEKVHMAFFKRFHESGQGINSVADVEPYFKSNGVSPEELQKAWNDPSIEAKIDEGRALVRKFQIGSVPTFVVNQKFKTSVEIAGDEKKLSRKLNELAINNGK